MTGYIRKDNRKGIRNVIVVTYLVECAHHVAEQIARQTDSEALPVHLIGFGGCAPNAYAQEIMERLCTHPNVGGVVIVSLGSGSGQRERTRGCTHCDSGGRWHPMFHQQGCRSNKSNGNCSTGSSKS